MINILYEDNHVLVVEKPINVPVQEDSSKDVDFLNILKQYIKDKYKKPGNVYLGLVHRLDRPTGGVMVFAKTSKAASRLSKQIIENKMVKKYYAVVEGNTLEEGYFEDFLIKDYKLNIVTVNEKGKKAILSYKKIAYKNNYSLVDIILETGRSHQIRVQFSHHGYPLYGDQKYNKNEKVGRQLALFAYSLSFAHPITKELMTFKLSLPKKVPFSWFENE